MLVNLKQTILNLEGEPMTDAGSAEATTLKELCCRALLSIYPDEQNLSGEQKFKRYKLAMKITDDDEVNLTAEEIADLKKLIGKAFGPLIVGRAWELLDPESNIKPMENQHIKKIGNK